MASFMTSLENADQGYAASHGTPDLKIYLVGGAVRDLLLGRRPRDFDFSFEGDPKTFLQANPSARKVGRSIPVFLLHGREYTALRGADVAADLAARDFTVNSLALEANGVLHCHPSALSDLKAGLLRPASETAFTADPLRVFRAARLLCELPGFRLHPSVPDLMREAKNQGLLDALPPERVGAELVKALASPRPSAWAAVLDEAGCLSPWFIELEQASHIPAGPRPYHSESVLGHLMEVMDAVAGDPLRVWAAFCHDLGKTLTPPELWPHHYGHENKGVAVASRLAERLGLSNRLRKAGKLSAGLHMRAGRYRQCRPGTRRDLLLKVHASGLWDAFWAVVEADTGEAFRESADKDLKTILDVRLPPGLQNLGEESGRRLRDLQCSALANCP